MPIKDRVLNQAANWLALAEKGEISYETASLLINSFELGMAEFAEEVSQKSLHQHAYEQVQDINQYIKNTGQKVLYPACSQDVACINRISSEIQNTINFKSRSLHNKVNILSNKE